MQQQPGTPTGLPNQQVCHRNLNPVQLLPPRANPPNNAFCGFSLFTRGLSAVPGTSGITSEHLLLGPKTTFLVPFGHPKGPLRSFFTTFHPKLGLVPLNVASLWAVTTLQANQSCLVGASTQQQPCTPTGLPNHQVATGIPALFGQINHIVLFPIHMGEDDRTLLLVWGGCCSHFSDSPMHRSGARLAGWAGFHFRYPLLAVTSCCWSE